MKHFIVTEVVRYKVKAGSEEEAIQWIIDHADRDKVVIEVSERYAEEEGGSR